MKTDRQSFFDQEKSRISLSFIQELCNAMPVGIHIVKPVRNASDTVVDFEYVYANDTYIHSNGNSNPGGKTLLAIHPEKTEVFNRLIKTMNDKAPVKYVHEFMANGDLRWLQDSYTLLSDGVLIVTQDITEQLKAEAQASQLNLALAFKNRQLESLKSELQTFTNVAANDYKETLRNLYTGLEYIASHEAGNLTDTGKANVRRAQASIQKMKLLTEDIITYSTIPNVEGSFTSVNLNEILEAVKNDLSAKLGKTMSGLNVMTFL